MFKSSLKIVLRYSGLLRLSITRDLQRKKSLDKTKVLVDVDVDVDDCLQNSSEKVKPYSGPLGRNKLSFTFGM